MTDRQTAVRTGVEKNDGGFQGWDYLVPGWLTELAPLKRGGGGLERRVLSCLLLRQSIEKRKKKKIPFVYF